VILLVASLLVATAAAADSASCPLLQVIPQGKEVEAPFRMLGNAEGTLAFQAFLGRGSLVWRLPSPACGASWTVQVLSEDPLYVDERRGPPPAVLSVGCIDASDVVPVNELPAADADGRRFTLAGSASCVLPAGTLPYNLLESVAPRREPPGLELVRSTWERLYGPLPPGEPRATDWGFVALPFAHTLDQAELDARDRKEKFVSQDSRARGVWALGPGQSPVYVHALGDDDPDSDTWGRPELVATILELAHSWYDRCTTVEAPALKIKPDVARKACALQVNDLAWYNDRSPDPLGHNSHGTGRCVDVRPFRDDGSWYETNWRKRDDRPGVGQHYSRQLTMRFLSYAIPEYHLTNVIFNDSYIRRRLKTVHKLRNHDDHMHLCIASDGRGGGQQAAATIPAASKPSSATPAAPTEGR
jgi:hypothetical protein